MNLQMLLRVIKQPRADAHLVIMILEDVEMPAALASLPEFGVVRQFGERNRTEAEFVVELHYRCSRGDREDLCIREKLAAQQEGLLLDAP